MTTDARRPCCPRCRSWAVVRMPTPPLERRGASPQQATRSLSTALVVPRRWSMHNVEDNAGERNHHLPQARHTYVPRHVSFAISLSVHHRIQTHAMAERAHKDKDARRAQRPDTHDYWQCQQRASGTQEMRSSASSALRKRTQRMVATPAPASCMQCGDV